MPIEVVERVGEMTLRRLGRDAEPRRDFIVPKAILCAEEQHLKLDRAKLKGCPFKPIQLLR
jgi:hypothetical protein